MKENIIVNKYTYLIIIFLFSILGLFVSAKLMTLELHYFKNVNTEAFSSCSINQVFDCSSVATSKYSEIFGFPNMILGLIFYSCTFVTSILLILKSRLSKVSLYLANFVAFGGWIFSLILLYISLFILHKVCLYCLASTISATFLLITWNLYLIRNPETSYSQKLTLKYENFLNSKYRYIYYLVIFFLIYALIISFAQIYSLRYFDQGLTAKSIILLPWNVLKTLWNLIFH